MKFVVCCFTSLLGGIVLTACGTEVTDTAIEPLEEEIVQWACRTDFGESHEATQGFWDAIRDDDKAARNQVIEDLANAMELHPNEEVFALLHGMANLWKVAEPLPEESGDVGLQAMAAMDSRASLEKLGKFARGIIELPRGSDPWFIEWDWPCTTKI